MKKTIVSSLLVAAIGIMVSACAPSTYSQIVDNQKRHHTHDHIKAMPLGDNAETSLDWAGTYQGILPCGKKCPDLETTLILKRNHTYVLLQKPWQSNDAQIKRSSGQFSFSRHQPSLIYLDSHAHRQVFFVSEGYVEARAKNTGERLPNALSQRLQQIQRD